jgi:hypothetical protein
MSGPKDIRDPERRCAAERRLRNRLEVVRAVNLARLDDWNAILYTEAALDAMDKAAGYSRPKSWEPPSPVTESKGAIAKRGAPRNLDGTFRK